MGSHSFSPDMQRAINHVRRVFPGGFATACNRSTQPLKSTKSCGIAAVDSMKQPFEAFHYCTRESYAVVDTGCQRSAVGKRTLEHIISRLPSGLNVKFDNQKFRFSGIGGETVTSQVALIPVAFGQRPGMVRAAVLEDTPDAPFLLSLPILKELHTSVHLSEQNMHFQSINETGSMFYNVRGQLCLRLFDFDQIQSCPAESSNRWIAKKIIGDECQVFMLQEPQERDVFGNLHNQEKSNQFCIERNMATDLGIAKGSCEMNHMPVSEHDSLATSVFEASESFNVSNFKCSVQQF